MSAWHSVRFYSRFLPVWQFLSLHSHQVLTHGGKLAPCEWINQGVQFRPARFGKCHEICFVVNWHYTNKYCWLRREMQFIQLPENWCGEGWNNSTYAKEWNVSMQTLDVCFSQSDFHQGTARLNGSVSVDLSCFPVFFLCCELDWNWTLLGVVKRTKQTIHQVDWTSPTQTQTHTPKLNGVVVYLFLQRWFLDTNNSLLTASRLLM